MTTRIYLDIETIPGQDPAIRDEIAAGIEPPGNMKKQETIEKWEAEEKPAKVEEEWRKTAFSGDRGEVVAISWAVDEGPVEVMARGLGDSEGELLSEWGAAVAAALNAGPGRGYHPPQWVGHNVRDFDLRFLFQRSVINGIAPPVALPHDARPGSEQVFDTMEAWAGFKGRISLDRLCRALGIATKGTEIGGEEIDGSKVWDYIQAGRIEDVATYCAADVERVRELHHRLTFHRAAATEGEALIA